ncbi:MAG: hypothetical protein Q4G00_03690 [Clostridia bacterium]|nr:hypothetical protein [Clostridia bacterium]
MKLKTGWAFMLMVILVVGSVIFGAYRGWSDERARVNETYAGLESMLQTRVESAYNVLAVARRHVPETDEHYQNVKNELAVLEGKAALGEKARANEALTRDAGALLNEIAALDSVKRDDRDSMYVNTYLPQMLAQSEEKTAGAAYNQAAADFNSRMKGTFSGWLARTLLGIKPAEEFIAQ